jgi:hypothetical protein
MVAMYEQIANSLAVAIYGYICAGALFALVFVTVGVTRLDHEAGGSGPIFRAIIFPGAVALWPLLLVHWVRGQHEPPTQKDPHR